MRKFIYVFYFALNIYIYKCGLMYIEALQNNTHAYYVLLIIISAVKDNVWTIYSIINESVTVNAAEECRETGVLSTMSRVNKWCCSFILETKFRNIFLTLRFRISSIVYKINWLWILKNIVFIILMKISYVTLCS